MSDEGCAFWWPRPVVTIVRLADEARAREALRRLAAAGLAGVEVTLNTPGALGLIAAARAAGRPVGAGTVCTRAQAEAAAAAGAAFLVAPGLDEAALDWALARGLPMLPGVATASEVMRARAHGARVMKFFPAQALGGPAALRALRGPFDDVAFVPSGGVTIENAAGYFAAGALGVGLGGELCAPIAGPEPDWPAFEAVARRLRDLQERVRAERS